MQILCYTKNSLDDLIKNLLSGQNGNDIKRVENIYDFLFYLYYDTDFIPDIVFIDNFIDREEVNVEEIGKETNQMLKLQNTFPYPIQLGKVVKHICSKRQIKQPRIVIPYCFESRNYPNLLKENQLDSLYALDPNFGDNLMKILCQVENSDDNSVKVKINK